MSRRKRLYIAYGSNLNLPQMAFRCPTAKVVGNGVLKDYELLFRGSSRSAVATVEPKEGAAVPVLVWDIMPTDELSLDRYEGYPRFYEKQMMEVEMEGKKVSAMVYVMTPGHELGIPSEYYVETIRQGYETAGFDMDVLEAAVDHAYELTGQQRQEDGFWQESPFRMGGFKGFS